MLSRFAILVVLLLPLAGCNWKSYSRSTSGFSSLDKEILHDFRSHAPDADAGVDSATTQRILAVVFPSYLSTPRACKSAAEATAPGQIVPTIRGAAVGSFTAAGLNETAYLIDVGECGRDPVLSSRRLVVLKAGALTATAEVPTGTASLRTYDLNRDGKSELLLQGGHVGRGKWTGSARLVEFDKDRLVTVEDFGQIYDDTCDADVASRSISASVVYYLPPPAGQKPRFTVELYRAPCPAKAQPPQWTRVSGN